MHGYELIQGISGRFGGTYIPSAGTIYPRLAKLEEEGLVTKSADGRKTVYEITDAGRTELAARESELDEIESDLTDSVRRLADEVRTSVNDAMKTLRADLAAAAREARDDARHAGRTVGVDSARDTSGAVMREAEIVLTEFRHHVRAELRTRAAGGELTKDTVDSLKARLDAVRASL